MLHCPLSFVHRPFALLRVCRCRVGGDKGGVRVTARRASGEGFTLGTSDGLVGVDVWASERGRLLRRRGLAPGPGRGLCAAVVLGLREAVRNRRGSVVHGGSSRGRSGWR